MPEDRRVMAAVRNLGVLLLDPSLGFCETLSGMPSQLGHRPAQPADPLEEWLQTHWTPLFHGDWLAKPVRAFFRRVSLLIDETEFEERTVSPEAQAWMVRALSACCRHWAHEEEGFWPGLQAAWREMAGRIARFTADHLRTDGQVAARRFEFFEESANDWEQPLPLHQGLWLEALCDLYAAGAEHHAEFVEEVRLWLGTQVSTITAAFDQYLKHCVPCIAQARLLQGLLALQASPSLYREEIDPLVWNLTGHLVSLQGEDGSWEGNLLSTAECAAAIARAGTYQFDQGQPDALSHAIIWLRTMHGLGKSFPAPMAGLRMWEYRLNDVAAVLEAARRLSRAPLLHPEDRQEIVKLCAKWWQFTMGRRLTIPMSQRYGGLWVAGVRYVREQRRWYRDLRLEPGAIARLAYEAIQSCTPEPASFFRTQDQPESIDF